MRSPYVGEIRMFGGNFAPVGWALCQGQILPISENDVLFNLIGTTYGGDGQNTFALPDLRGRVPVGMGTGYPLAQSGGQTNVTLSVAQMPPHNHPFPASANAATSAAPASNVPAQAPVNAFSSATPNAPLSQSSIGAAGGGQAHENMMP